MMVSSVTKIELIVHKPSRIIVCQKETKAPWSASH